MAKSSLKKEATLKVILYMSKYFKNIPDDLKERKKFLKPYNNIKLRMKLLVNDVYGCLIQNEGFKSGISEGFKYAKDNNIKTKKVWEHTIPWEVFFYHLMKKNITKKSELDYYLKVTFCPCNITSDENERLDEAGLKNKMPEGWKRWRDRYDDPEVRIELAELPVNPSNPSLNITNTLLKINQPIIN